MMNRILRCFFAHVAWLSVLFLPILNVTAAQAQTVEIVRVDGAGGSTAPAGQGKGWGSNAYLYLQDGLTRADALLDLPEPPDSVQIWVRGSSTGISYRPDQGSGFTANDRGASFGMRPNVAVYGGFPDTGNPGFGDRDPATYITILTGEIGTGDDFSDNSYHVVSANDTVIDLDNCLLEGFTITRGNAEDENGGLGGGGIYIVNGSDLRVDQCLITDNRSGDAGYGAGIHINASNPVITRCTISLNRNNSGTILYGGGIVIENEAGSSENPVRIIDCIIDSNTAAHGGGVAIKTSAVGRLVNCLIVNNSINPNAAPNQEPFGGGVAIDRGSFGMIINCTFSGNEAGRGGAIAHYGTATDSVLANSILWNDNATQTKRGR